MNLKKGIDRDHTIVVQGQEIELETSYKVDERNLNDYVFTTPSIADLSVKLKNDAPQNYNIRVTNLYALCGCICIVQIFTLQRIASG